MDPDSSNSISKFDYFDYFSDKRIREILHKMSLNAQNLRGAGNTSSGSGCRILAAIYINKRFLTFGTNSRKSNPFQLKYGKNIESIYFHAETNAIKRAIDLIGFEELKKSRTTLFICRVKKMPNNRNFIWGISKPCRGCMTAIIDMNINNVIYTLDEDKVGGKMYEIMVR
ncbi:MAG: hypothetical protein QXR30_03695 [Candidatus Woesearchaeota archaeon]